MMRLIAPAISIAPHALQSIIAIEPATREAGPIRAYRITAPAVPMRTISSITVGKPPVMKPPRNAI